MDIEVYGPYPILINADGTNIYAKANVTNVSDQIGKKGAQSTTNWT